MKRFFIVFALIQLVLFGLKMLPSVQQAVVEPWTSLIARASAFIVRLFDPSALSYGRVLHSPSADFAISIEAGELLEAFLWKAAEDAKVEKVREELADVLNFAFQMADRYNLNIKDIMLEKIRKNAEKYPVDKAKGSAKKYNEI